MLKALFDENGLPQGFYNTDAYDDISFIPEKAIEITEDQYREFLDNIGRRKWNNGEVVEYELPTLDLAALKERLKDQLDRDAEKERQKYITPGFGQSIIYTEKLNQAIEYTRQCRAHEQNPDTTPKPDENAYPLLEAGLNDKDNTFIKVAETIIKAQANWVQIGSAIETIRLGAKTEIDNAKTNEAAQSIYDTIKWPEGS